ncbi:MAG: hypothetical protein HZB51_28625 [Chloroflexi bacterium]|nr:hypothetical protein [Chloroflexota bacterium]
MPRRLGEGESECLVIARIRRFKFATDDWDARQMARRLGIPLTGTIGILIVLVKEKKLTLTEAEGFFTRMLNAGFRAPIVSIKEFLGNA